MSIKSSSKRKIVERQFDSYCKICLKRLSINKRSREWAPAKEVHLADLPYSVQASLVLDEMPLAHHFEVAPTQQHVLIRDDRLAAALESLCEPNRTIILMHMSGYTDVAIASLIDMQVDAVRYQRIKALRNLRTCMEAMMNEE